MSDELRCPSCAEPLVGLEEGDESSGLGDSAGSLACSGCGGVFIPGSSVDGDLLVEAQRVEAAADAEPAAAGCPDCGEALWPHELGEQRLNRCDGCGGVWLEPLPEGDAGVVASIGRYLLYSLSLPERAVRGSVGLAAGAVKETAGMLVPRAFQSSKTYQIVVVNSLKFLTRDIAGIKESDEEGNQGVEGYLARKTIGNFIDLAGLATLHVSPLWLLAIVSDLAYGTKTYVRELGAELKKQGLIDKNSTINHVEDILNAVQGATGEAAGLFDTPPLSVDDLKSTLDTTRQAIASADYTGIVPEGELKRYWNEMREIATEEDVSLLGVSGALTMRTLQRVGAVSQGAFTGVKLAGGLFNRQVITHYVDGIKAIREQGFYPVVRDASAPYVEAVWDNFSTDRSSWTEELLSGRAVGKAWGTVAGWFGRVENAERTNGGSQEGPVEAD